MVFCIVIPSKAHKFHVLTKFLAILAAVDDSLVTFPCPVLVPSRLFLINFLCFLIFVHAFTVDCEGELIVNLQEKEFEVFETGKCPNHIVFYYPL